MQKSSRQIFEELKESFSEEQIFKKCEFSKERFMKNLEKEERGDINQLTHNQATLFINENPSS